MSIRLLAPLVAFSGLLVAAVVFFLKPTVPPLPEVAAAPRIASATPVPEQPPAAPRATPSPFGPPSPDIAEAPPAVAVVALPETPADEPWTFLLEPQLLDQRGNAVFTGGTIELIAIDTGGTTRERVTLTPGEPARITMAAWPKALAVGGAVPDGMVARAVFALPPAESVLGPAASRAEVTFDDPERGVLERAGQVSQATGQARWAERFAREERIDVMFAGDSRVHPATRRDLPTPTPWTPDEADLGIRTLRLDLVVRVAYFGRIEAQVLEELPADAIAATVVAVEPGEAGAAVPPPTDAARAAATEAAATQRARRTADPVENVLLDRPMRGGQRPGSGGGGGRGGAAAEAGEGLPDAVARELRAGAEPMAYRLAQRAFVMEQTPVIDADRIIFPRVPPGRYALEVVTKEGRLGRSEPFDVVELETAQVKVPVVSGTTLEVTVTTKEGNDVIPVQGATVSLRRGGGPGGGGPGGGGGRGGRGGGSAVAFNAAGGRGDAPSQGRSGRTGDDGRVLLTALDPGRAELVVRHEQFAEARATVTLGPGANSERVGLFRERAKVELRVVSSDGHDVLDGLVTANRQRRFFGRGRSEAEVPVRMGRARLELDYGVWVFAAEAEGFARSTLPEMEIADPGPHELTITLAPRLDVTLHLTRRGEPMAAAPVTLFSRAESTFGPNLMTTDGAGIATFQVAPGDYAVYTGNRYLDTVDVTVDGDNVFHLEVKPITVDGYLRSAADQSPVTRARIRLVAEVDPDSASYTIPSVFRDPRAQSNAEGYYLMADVDEGLYRLEVTARGFASLITDPMELTAEAFSGPMVHELSPVQGSIEGRITRPDGSPVEGVFIRQALNEQGVPYPINFREVMSDADGNYRMRGLEPGLYLVQFAGQPWRGMNYLPHTSPVLDVVDETPVRYDLVMVPGGSVRFSVRDSEGVAVGSVRFALVDGSGTFVSTPYVESPDPVSDVVGEFHWTELRAGTYRIVATRDGFTQADQALTVTVEPDRTVRVTVVMNRL